ncbi:hypothetical protein BVRB_7g178190 [Beta vulgaris subsp. vulgaris]|nr:hypothetical protein BVRB_7g178190 [Beta vulgaris subsp. vulgaris]
MGTNWADTSSQMSPFLRYILSDSQYYTPITACRIYFNGGVSITFSFLLYTLL